MTGNVRKVEVNNKAASCDQFIFRINLKAISH